MFKSCVTWLVPDVLPPACSVVGMFLSVVSHLSDDSKGTQLETRWSRPDAGELAGEWGCNFVCVVSVDSEIEWKKQMKKDVQSTYSVPLNQFSAQ